MRRIFINVNLNVFAISCVMFLKYRTRLADSTSTFLFQSLSTRTNIHHCTLSRLTSWSLPALFVAHHQQMLKLSAERFIPRFCVNTTFWCLRLAKSQRCRSACKWQAQPFAPRYTNILLRASSSSVLASCSKSSAVYACLLLPHVTYHTGLQAGTSFALEPLLATIRHCFPSI